MLRSPQEVAMLLMKQEPAWSPGVTQSSDHFSSMKTDLCASLPENSLWCSNDEMNPNIFGSQTPATEESNGNSLAESIQSVLQSDKITELLDGNMFYNAFDDIDTTEDEADSFPGFEEQRMTEDSGTGPKILSEVRKAEIDRVVESHDKSYFSVNFGEVLIKDMLMCSMFGVQVNFLVLFF